MCAKTILIVGASGGIGSAIAKQLQKRDDCTRLICAARSYPHPLHVRDNGVERLRVDLQDPTSIQQLAAELAGVTLDQIWVTSGVLHRDQMQPEKRLSQLVPEHFHTAMQINALAPLQLLQVLTPNLNRTTKSQFLVLSARVSSISDNRLGGWYSYRASKAALNMLLKNASIELARTHPNLTIAALHPGTVATKLSKPFQKNVPPEKLFTPEQSAGYLIKVADRLKPEQSGRIWAWDGTEVLP